MRKNYLNILKNELTKKQIAFEYSLKEKYIEKKLMELPNSDRKNLAIITTNATSFWAIALIQYLSKRSYYKSHKEKYDHKILVFSKYLRVNILESLLNNKAEPLRIYNTNWGPAGIFEELLGFSNLLWECRFFEPLKIDMYISKDKITVNNLMYYNILDDEQTNNHNIDICLRHTFINNIKEVENLFENKTIRTTFKGKILSKVK